MRFWRTAAAAGGAAAASGVAWGHFEAGWVRLRTLELRLQRLPLALDGVRIAHLSDFHFGLPSRGIHAVERAVDWVEERRPDLVLITGDLVSRPRGEVPLRRSLERLGPSTFVVLGNHDVEHSRDPFSRSADLTNLEPAQLLVDESAVVAVRGVPVQIVGVDPRAYRQRRSVPWRFIDESAELRILLCHFPYVFDMLPPGAFDLVVAGHMHDGQISLPLGRTRRFRFAHPRVRYATGIYTGRAGTMHVSPGLGTTFVPFRFFARPEATELVLRRG